MIKRIQNFFASKPAPLKNNNRGHAEFQLLSSEQLLSKYPEALAEIQELSGIPIKHYQALYLRPLEKVVSYIQLIPASENHHHSYAGGMLDHLFEIILNALKLRRAQILPPGVDPEEIELRKDVWTYAIFIAALTHDIGKVIVDTQFMADNEPWNPLTDKHPSSQYSYRYNPNRKHKFHERLPLLVLHKFVPMEHLQWVQNKDLDAFEALISCLSGDYENAGALGDIVQKADQYSVIESIGGDVKVASNSTSLSLHENLLRYLRKIVAETEALPANRKGAACFTTEYSAYFVSKRTLDSIKESMRQDGQSVPGRNDRLMDELQQFKVIIPFEDKAIWKCTIQIGDWSQNFSLLRFPIEKVWPKISERPENATDIRVIPLDLNDNPILDEVIQTPENSLQSKVSETPIQPSSESKKVEAENCPKKSIEKPVETPSKTSLIKPTTKDQPKEIDELEALMSEVNTALAPIEGTEGLENDFSDYSDLDEPINTDQLYEQSLLDAKEDENMDADTSNPTQEISSFINNAPNEHSETLVAAVANRIKESQTSSVDYHNQKVLGDPESQLEFDNPNSHGARFIKWLVEGIKSGHIPINQPSNRVHVVPEGLFLVSPSIFRQFESENINTTWQKAQRELTKKKINLKTETGENIFEYEILSRSGRGNNASSIKGIIIPNPEAKLQINLNSRNEFLKKKH